MMSFFSIFIVLITFFRLDALAAPTDFFTHLFQRDDPVCNGNSALCDRKYSSISFIGTHDSPFVGPLPSQNQEKSVQDQLNSGIRFLQSQSHNFLGNLFMCHTSCLLENAGLVQKYLQTVKNWMDQNPREVVTLLITNPDRQAMSKFDALFKKVGADKMAFVPSSSPNPLAPDAWPTLGEMIDSGKRLVVFIDYNANENSVPYILDEFNYFFEGPFNTIDPQFNQCDMDRKNKVDNEGGSSMYLVNHYLDLKIGDITVPDRLDAARTNSAEGSGSVGEQVDLCNQKWGRPPNVVLVDYFGRGNPLDAQNKINAI